jgi:hypothetical protein
MSKKYIIKTKTKKREFLKLGRKIFDNSIFHKKLKLKFNPVVPPEALYLYANKKLIGFIEYGQSPEYFDEFGIKFLAIDNKYSGHKLGYILISEVIKRTNSLVKYIYLSIPFGANFLKNYYSYYGFNCHKTLYATKYKSGFFCWSSEKAKSFFSKSDPVLRSRPKIIMRLNIRSQPNRK